MLLYVRILTHSGKHGIQNFPKRKRLRLSMLIAENFAYVFKNTCVPISPDKHCALKDEFFYHNWFNYRDMICRKIFILM